MITVEEAIRRYYVKKRHGIFRIDFEPLKIHIFTDTDVPNDIRKRVQQDVKIYFGKRYIYEWYIISGGLYHKRYQDNTVIIGKGTLQIL